MPKINFKDHRRIGFEVLENEYSFGDFLVINEVEHDKENEYRRITFIHEINIEDEEIERCFLNIVENKYTEEECHGKCCKSDIDGSITPERSFFPKEFQDFCNKEESLLEQTIIRFFDNALWVYKSSSLFLHDPGYHWIQFSFDKKDWYLVPILPMGGMFCSAYDMVEYHKKEEALKAKNKQLACCLTEMMSSGHTAPIYPRIYFEAVKNMGENHQTAIVLAIESVEVAVKTCITHYDDRAKWLMENVPSPPLVKMLKEYIPTLIPKDAPKIPKNLINHSLHDAIAARNKIVHSGLYKTDYDQTKSMVYDMGRILAYLDYYIGCDWAHHFFDRPFNHWFFE